MPVPLIRKEDLGSFVPPPVDWPEHERRRTCKALLVAGPAHVETRLGFHTEEQAFYLIVDEESGFPITIPQETFERNWRLADDSEPATALELEATPDGPKAT